MYALATVPLIQKLSSSSQVIQTWYADDVSAAGQLCNIRIWWEHINKMGPKFGYFPNGAKSWLVVKNDCLLEASELFKDTNIQITSKGRPLLWSPIGSSNYVKQYVQTKVKKWCESLGCLSDIARIHPQSVYSAFVCGVAGWSISLCRTTPDICHLLMPLEDIIKTKLILALTGRDSSNKLRNLFSLPVRHGGLGINIPTELLREFESSVLISSPLVSLIIKQEIAYTTEVLCEQISARLKVRKMKRVKSKSLSAIICESLPKDLPLSIELAKEKGASIWLSSLPVQEHGFSLHKAAFHDAFSVRYGWKPINMPSECICGNSFTVDHAFSCVRGVFPP